MPNRVSKSGSELFIVDNSDVDWKALRYLHDWCQISSSFDIATAYFEIGSLLALKDEWKKVDKIRILMGDEVTKRTKKAFAEGLKNIVGRLDSSLETEKQNNDFLEGVPAIVDAIRSGKIECRVYRKNKFHAKAYITHARLEVVGASALVGSSNFTAPGLTENIELNVQITGRPVAVLQEWYEEHWNEAEDVSVDILRTIERHTHDYPPFLVYARALHELFRRQEMSDPEWFKHESRLYPILDQYQKEGFHHLIEIAGRNGGALLCDGVGLGKTFIGLMLIEYLILKKRKRVALIVPKVGRVPVWETSIKKYLPQLAGGVYSSLAIFNHTDLLRGGEFPERLQRVKEMADVVLIDEAHHFRNPGFSGVGRGRLQPTTERAPSRYQHLFELLQSGPGNVKQLYMLTATPINNKLTDLQHMIELFSRKQPDFFKRIGIHSLPGHFRKMEKDLLTSLASKGVDETTATDLAEAEELLTGDTLFKELVVQRSRAYVRESQLLQLNNGEPSNGEPGAAAPRGRSVARSPVADAPGSPSNFATFPTREPPRVASYSVKKTYGKLLKMVEAAFSKEKPLFYLAIYYPLAYYNGADATIDPIAENRQKQVVGLIRTQFLKRFESSAHAFEFSCERMMMKMLAFVTKQSESPDEKEYLAHWLIKHQDLTGYVHDQQPSLFDDDDPDEDVISEEMLEEIPLLSREEYDVPKMLRETFFDLDEIADFLDELRKLKPTNDDKLKALAKLLKSDPALKNNKVLIFSEFSDTARYLKRELAALGVDGIEQIDSGTKGDRADCIARFAPYYNGSSSGELGTAGQLETRILISTDVLSEGLNLQDAVRMINYDLHWNPVRLMQRIGRVDRRLNPEVEAKLVADHPELLKLRGNVIYWNFLPPDELDDLLRLYTKVAHKTLRISKTFGIEGQKLLRPEDDYEALKNFNHKYEGAPTPAENIHLEYQTLVRGNPELAAQIAALPGRVFSGKRHPTPGTRAVFFCFILPAADHSIPPDDDGQLTWTEEAGRAAWYLFDVVSGTIVDEPTKIVDAIRCKPDEPRYCSTPQSTLAEIRGKIEKHIKNTYLRSVQAPGSVKPVLKAWMELS